jgi:DNA-binding transcriptional LysR family regulator
MAPTLRQMSCFVAVAEHASFTAAAQQLGVAQQALSQQVRALEEALGVALLRRSSRRVEITAEGRVFLADARRILTAADRAVGRVRAAARGEAGLLRVAYTLTMAYQTVPALVELLATRQPLLKLQTREVYGSDIAELLETDGFDLAIAPMTAYPAGMRHEAIRREVIWLAVSTGHRLAGRRDVELASLAGERFEFWPREMSPGFYDVVVGACRSAGFEPALDEHAAGSTCWEYIAQGRGVGMVAGSAAGHLPAGIELAGLAAPAPVLTVEAVWRHDAGAPAIPRLLEAAAVLASERQWM